MTGPITSLARRVLLAAECDERSEIRALVHAGPATSCAALGSVVGHVIRTLSRDRKLVNTWLETPKGAKA
jgi:hypothetical protein